MADTKDISGFCVGDIVKMKKIHPCGAYEWTIERMGADIWLKCSVCARRIIIDRDTFYRRVKGARERLKEHLKNCGKSV